MVSNRLLAVAVAACVIALTGGSAAVRAQSGSGGKGGDGSWMLSAGVETTTALYSMSGSWWGLASGVDPSFDERRRFAEIWLHPQVRASRGLTKGAELYGAVSAGIALNVGTDAFDYKDEGAARFENAYLGVRSETPSGWRHELSVGRQAFTLGSGMLLTAGSSNGYSWGAGASSKRQAWRQALVGKVGQGDWTAQVFSLEPSEVFEARTDTRVQGVSLEWADDDAGKAGLAWINVPRSAAIYPGDLAPLGYIEDGREGLKTWHGWLAGDAFLKKLPGLGLRAEFAHQRNDIRRISGRVDDMRAEAWLLGMSYWAKTLPFAPKISFHQAYFSGDDPDSRTYERFDPMFWGNGLDNWWFGANGAYAWLNSNIRAQRISIDGYLSEKDIILLQYVRTQVDQVNSVVQYGQGLRITDSGDLLVGVPERNLSDEYYVQYAHVFTPKLVLSGFIARSVPGDGLEAISTDGVDKWNTAGITLTANF